MPCRLITSDHTHSVIKKESPCRIKWLILRWLITKHTLSTKKYESNIKLNEKEIEKVTHVTTYQNRCCYILYSVHFTINGISFIKSVVVIVRILFSSCSIWNKLKPLCYDIVVSSDLSFNEIFVSICFSCCHCLIMQNWSFSLCTKYYQKEEKGKAQYTSMSWREEQEEKGNDKRFKIHTYTQTLVSERERTHMKWRRNKHILNYVSQKRINGCNVIHLYWSRKLLET